MRTGNFTTPCRAASSPSASRSIASGSSGSPRRRSEGAPRGSIIIALNVLIELAHLAERLPLTAADMSEAEDWLIEQPVAGDLDVGERAVLDVEVDHDLVAAQRVEALDPVRRGRVQLAAVARASGSGRG